MPEDTVKSVIQIQLELAQAEKDWKAFRKQFQVGTAEDMRKELEKYEDSIKSATKLSKNLSSSQKEQVKGWKAAAAALRENIKETEAKEKADTAAAQAVSPEQIQATADAWETQREQVSQYITTVDQAKVAIQNTRDEIRALSTSNIADSEATQQVIAQKKEYLTVLQSLLAQHQLEEQAVRRTTQAQEQHEKGTVKLVKKILTWGAGVASVYYLYRKLRTEVQEAIKDVYSETEQYKNLNDAAINFRRTLVLSVLNYDDTLEFFERLAGALNKAADWVTKFSGQMAGLSATLDVVAKRAGPLEDFVNFIYKLPAAKSGGQIAMAIMKWAQEQGLLNEQLDLSQAYLEGYNNQLNSIQRGLEGAGDATKDYANAISSLVQHQIDAAEAQREIDAAWEQAKTDWASAQAVAQGELAANIMKININLEKEIDKINQDALDERAQAYSDYQGQLVKAQKQAQKQEQDDLKRHLLEMEFARRQHQLSQVQNERVYQYERARLVAEGDVLAIEDLDARYKLERKAQEENFQLQMEQSEALFRLQAKIQAEAMRDQIRELQSALQEQLRAIEEGRRKQIDEAEERAAEERMQAKTAYGDQLADARETYEEAKEEKRKAEEAQLKDTAEFLADLSHETGIGLDELLAVYQTRYGANSELVKLTKQTYDEVERETQFWTAAITNLMSEAGKQAGSAFSRAFISYSQSALSSMSTVSRFPTVNMTPGVRPSFRYQYGGEAIYSQPTNIQVGHGPERVIVQPLTSLGGNFNVNLGGRAVIEGQGKFSGMDMAMVNATVNDALHSAFSTFMTSRQNIKGKRGF